MNEDDERDSAGMGLGRTLALSDGVFAIAMTLLAFQIQLPSLAQPEGLTHALSLLLGHFGVYFLSFAVIGLLWLAHHRLFIRIARADEPLMMLNLLFLMVVAALPFPSAVLGQYGSQRSAVVLYASAMAVAGMLLTGITLLARRRRLLEPGTPPESIRRGLWNSSTMAAIFIVSIPIALAWPSKAPFTWLALLPIRMITGRRLKKNPRSR